MNDKNNYVDKTVLSTPEPRASSTVQKKKMSRPVNELYNVDHDDSLGILSLKSEDIATGILENSAATELYQQRLLANSSLQKASRLSSLPSRYLRSSDVTKHGVQSCFNVSSGSTISESDLLPSEGKILRGDTSTPRDSMVSDAERDNLPRYSLGKSLAELSDKIKNTDIALESFTEEFQKVMKSVIIEEDSDMFTPAEAVEEKLIADELSWRRQNDVPGQTSLCFTENNSSLPIKVSMGEFFRLKSESLSDLDVVAKSPEKNADPIPLINSTSNDGNFNINAELELENSHAQDSLSVSKIAKILEDTKQTPRRAVSYLFNNENKKKKNEVDEVFDISDKCRGDFSDNNSKTKSNIYSMRLCNPSSTIYENPSMQCKSYNKENINSLNIQNHVNTSVESGPSHILDSANTSVASRKSPDYPINTDRSITSVRSTSSLSNLANGKLPIDSTKTEFIWGCVKPGKSAVQEVVIRNKSQSRLRLQCAVSGPSYKILKDRPETEYVSIAKYVLQPGESKRISISFAPINVGAAIDSASFSPMDQSLNHYRSQKIGLFGYGGYGNVEINNITKDITGKFWLCLGNLENRTPLCKTIIVQNTGTLPAFSYISFESKDMYSFSNISVTPQKFVLLPQEQREITVTYTPSRSDLKFFQFSLNNSLIEIGILKVILGTEVNRARIKRLCKRASEKGLGVSQICDKLIEHIPGEVFPPDINQFKESIRAITELLTELSTREIVLTLEQDPEATLLAQFPDDTLYFQTLCQDSTLNIEGEDKNSLRLEPNCIILTPPTKSEDVFLLSSDCNDPVHYEIRYEPTDLIICHEKGTIKPGDTILINVKYTKSAEQMIIYKLSVVTDNCILDATIKVLKIR